MWVDKMVYEQIKPGRCLRRGYLSGARGCYELAVLRMVIPPYLRFLRRPPSVICLMPSGLISTDQIGMLQASIVVFGYTGDAYRSVLRDLSQEFRHDVYLHRKRTSRVETALTNVLSKKVRPSTKL
jgi:hypothetical protein